MTPSSDTFSLTMILPISVLHLLMLYATKEVDTGKSGNWAPNHRPVHPAAGVHTRTRHDTTMKRGDCAVVTADLISRARAGNGDAFRELTEPHRRELQVHCYRMLGSLQDAEDALQDTLLSAWQGFAAFEERASLRTWLYRIATNRCLNVRRSAGRGKAKEWDVAGIRPPEPTQLGEIVWPEPIPDAFLEDPVHFP